jgi:hypothetical protein
MSVDFRRIKNNVYSALKTDYAEKIKKTLGIKPKSFLFFYLLLVFFKIGRGVYIDVCHGQFEV